MKSYVSMAFALSAALVGCQTPPAAYAASQPGAFPAAPKAAVSANKKPYSLTAADVKAVKAAVNEALKDPTSAIFGKLKAVKSNSGVITVCGFVNGKNSFGGYVGQKPFIGALTEPAPKGTFVVIGMGGPDIQTHATYATCAKEGIIL